MEPATPPEPLIGKKTLVGMMPPPPDPQEGVPGVDLPAHKTEYAPPSTPSKRTMIGLAPSSIEVAPAAAAAAPSPEAPPQESVSKVPTIPPKRVSQEIAEADLQLPTGSRGPAKVVMGVMAAAGLLLLLVAVRAALTGGEGDEADVVVKELPAAEPATPQRAEAVPADTAKKEPAETPPPAAEPEDDEKKAPEEEPEPPAEEEPRAEPAKTVKRTVTARRVARPTAKSRPKPAQRREAKKPPPPEPPEPKPAASPKPEPTPVQHTSPPPPSRGGGAIVRESPF